MADAGGKKTSLHGVEYIYRSYANCDCLRVIRHDRLLSVSSADAEYWR